jgi:chromosome segregation ATPase
MKPRAVLLAAALTLWGVGGQAVLAGGLDPETAQGQDDFQEKAQGELDKLEQQLDELAGKLDAARGEVRERLARSLEELRKKRDLVRRRLEELKESGGQAAQDLRDRLERALEDLRKGLEKTKDEDEPVWT